MQDKRNNIAIVIAIIVLYVCQFLNYWGRQDLINHYLECRQKILELQQDILELHKGIQEPLEEIHNILKNFESP